MAAPAIALGRKRQGEPQLARTAGGLDDPDVAAAAPKRESGRPAARRSAGGANHQCRRAVLAISLDQV
jgi:hypothetical protein